MLRSPSSPARSGLLGRDVRVPVGQQVAQFIQLIAQVFAGHDLADGQPQGGQLTGQILGVGLGLRGAAVTAGSGALRNPPE